WDGYARSSILQRANGAHQLRCRHFLAINSGSSTVLAHGTAQAIGGNFESQLVARHYWPAEPCAIYTNQVVGDLAIGGIDRGIALEREKCSGLSHGFYDQDARHDRMMREVPLEERFVH